MNFEYDQVHIICPLYDPSANENETEKFIIYNVSKVEYETCRITNPNPRIIVMCDKPFSVTLVTISFRPFTPQPGGLEFKPGQDYYFICKLNFKNILKSFLKKSFKTPLKNPYLTPPFSLLQQHHQGKIFIVELAVAVKAIT